MSFVGAIGLTAGFVLIFELVAFFVLSTTAGFLDDAVGLACFDFLAGLNAGVDSNLGVDFSPDFFGSVEGMARLQLTK